jgi:hypothetical protein
MDVARIIKEIDSLPVEGKVQIYSYIYSSLNKRDQILVELEKYRGIGKGVWREDAQNYVNRLREDDRS